MVKGVCILGSTGSVGRNTCRVIQSLADRFRVIGLTAGGNLRVLNRQIHQLQPKIVSVRDLKLARSLRERLRMEGYRPRVKIVFGSGGMSEAATHPQVDTVVSASHGVTGLEATYRAVESGKSVALANKETLVVAGELITRLARKTKSDILPVDSEHNAIHQCLRAGRREEVRNLILTASGGPFLKTSRRALERIRPEQALRHPTWKMGGRITLDSATLMNKGFEVIEAHWLFRMPSEAIQVLIHPQSIVHSMVEFKDGSLIAQMGVADMKLPIRYALNYPDRLSINGVAAKGASQLLSWEQMKRLDFELPDLRRFPCLGLAREALESGGSMPCALNAADEVAVEAFLKRRVKFTDIPRLIQRVLRRTSVARLRSLADVWDCDREARAYARESLLNDFT
ncbi:MAG: 1-deoxy-D-xylulose-5-phosphate reductoisomerase [Acidobacteria bacterium]|nr:1-deoxy-D-xylulose-5-phosphate reductoisomerase [Acidobacteriota bacterium]